MSVSAADNTPSEFTLEELESDMTATGDTPELVAMELTFDQEETSGFTLSGERDEYTLNQKLILALTSASAFIQKAFKLRPLNLSKESLLQIINLSDSLIAHARKGAETNLLLKQLVTLMTNLGPGLVLEGVANALAQAPALTEAAAIALANNISYLIKCACYKAKGKKGYLSEKIQTEAEPKAGATPVPELFTLPDHMLVVGTTKENSHRFSPVTTQAALAFAARALAGALISRKK